jgi:hypothetical protein
MQPRKIALACVLIGALPATYVLGQQKAAPDTAEQSGAALVSKRDKLRVLNNATGRRKLRDPRGVQLVGFVLDAARTPHF